MSIVLSTRRNTPLLIETANDLRRNAKRFVRDVRVSGNWTAHGGLSRQNWMLQS